MSLRRAWVIPLALLLGSGGFAAPIGSATSVAAGSVASTSVGSTQAATPKASAPPRSPKPTVLFVDVEGGPTTGGPDNLGVPISIFGKGFGTARGSSRVTIGGVEVSAYLQWGAGNAANSGLDMVIVQPGPRVVSGDIVVSVKGARSNAVPFAKRSGSIFFIAPKGVDANPCTQVLPCATVQHVASNVMRPGDSVLVRGGDYPESEVWIRDDRGQSGSVDRRKLIKAYPGETPRFVNASRPMILNANYITISGLSFLNGKALGNGSNEAGQRGNWIINNTFRGAIDFEATGSTGDDHILAGNDCVVDGSSQGTQGHCFYISFGNNVRLLYNVGRGAPGYGIHVFDQRRRASDFRRTISNLLIEGNTLTGSTNRAGLIVTMGDEDGIGNVIDGVTIRNNTFSGNDQLGAVVGGHVRNVRIHANVFNENGNAGLYVGGGSTTDNVEIRDNTFVQSKNTVCKVECTWYPTSHVIVEKEATRVVLAGNRYGPGAPVTIGTTDPTPR